MSPLAAYDSSVATETLCQPHCFQILVCRFTCFWLQQKPPLYPTSDLCCRHWWWLHIAAYLVLPLLIYSNLSFPTPVSMFKYSPSSLKTGSYHHPSLRIVRQGNNEYNEDLKGESREDPSESYPKINLISIQSLIPIMVQFYRFPPFTTPPPPPFLIAKPSVGGHQHTQNVSSSVCCHCHHRIPVPLFHPIWHLVWLFVFIFPLPQIGLIQILEIGTFPLPSLLFLLLCGFMNFPSSRFPHPASLLKSQELYRRPQGRRVSVGTSTIRVIKGVNTRIERK